MRRFVRILVIAACIAFTAGALNNVMGDATEVEKLAAEAACGPSPCNAQKTKIVRTPFGHHYEFAVPSGRAEVDCARTAYLFGEYRCKRAG